MKSHLCYPMNALIRIHRTTFVHMGPPTNLILRDCRSVCISLVRVPEGWSSYAPYSGAHTHSCLSLLKPRWWWLVCLDIWSPAGAAWKMELLQRSWSLGARLGFYSPTTLPVCSLLPALPRCEAVTPPPPQLHTLRPQPSAARTSAPDRLCPLRLRPKQTHNLLLLGHLDTAERKIKKYSPGTLLLNLLFFLMTSWG